MSSFFFYFPNHVLENMLRRFFSKFSSNKKNVLHKVWPRNEYYEELFFTGQVLNRRLDGTWQILVRKIKGKVVQIFSTTFADRSLFIYFMDHAIAIHISSALECVYTSVIAVASHYSMPHWKVRNAD
jgi:hypothetical protein